MQQIPVSTDANQSFKITLNNQSIKIKLRWQDISGSWFISLYDAQTGDAYIESRRLCPNIFVFSALDTSFSGDIVPFSQSNANDNIGRNDFQTDYGLYYFSPADLAELVDGNV